MTEENKEFEELNQELNQASKSTGSVLNHAFENYKGVVLIAAVVCIILFAISMIISSFFGISNAAIMEMSSNGGSYTDMYSSLPTSYYLSNLASGLISTIIVSPLLVGIIYLCHNKNVGKPVEFADVFIGFKHNTVNIMLYALIAGIIQYISLILCVIPVFFVMPLLFLGYPFLLFENANAIDAIKKSFNLVKENYWPFVGIAILSYLLSAVGIIACCIGIIFTYGYVYSAMYSAYVAYVGTPRELPQ